MINTKLWDPSKVGTLIIGSSRFGTHFLEKIIADWVGENGCIMHGEGFITGSDDNVLDKLVHFASSSQYSTLIVNQTWVKISLLSRPDLLDQWHTIRVTHSDKKRWFISWWFWLHHEKSFRVDKMQGEFHHHGTPQDVYKKYLESNDKISLEHDDISELLMVLMDHSLSYTIDVNEEIDYSDLRYLQNDRVRWAGNQYPEDYTLRDIFKNSEALEKILLTWNDLKPHSKFISHDR